MERNAKLYFLFFVFLLVPLRANADEIMVASSASQELILTFYSTQELTFFSTPVGAILAGGGINGQTGIDFGLKLKDFEARVPDLWLINQTTEVEVTAFTTNNETFFPENINFSFEPKENFTLIGLKREKEKTIYSFFTAEQVKEGEYNLTISISENIKISKVYNFIVAKDTTVNKLLLKLRNLESLKYTILVSGTLMTIISSIGLVIFFIRRKKKKEGVE